jgi:hypothetical protein
MKHTSALAGLLLLASSALSAAPLPGAIFTTDSTCSGVDLNIYTDKNQVYLDGGPAHPGAASLPDGSYYVQVTAPDGTFLGASAGADAVVLNGEFTECYSLLGHTGYLDTNNPGGEYKVWVSTVSTFDNNSTKTDNFKVKPNTVPPLEVAATLHVDKFYDANANGKFDTGDTLITGWQMDIHDGMALTRYTPTTVIVEAPDTYYVTEATPVQTNWFHTASILCGIATDASSCVDQQNAATVTVPLVVSDDKLVLFGNVCVGAGGGLTLGFWSNKNGQALFGADDLALMVSLNLRNANGTNFDPASYTAFRSWILAATATNMANMLSAQLAAMELNVLNGKVSALALIYAPGTGVQNGLGFATVQAVMDAANVSLGLNGNTTAADADRTLQEALKNALDRANNNLNFVQAQPCAFSFAP